MAIITLTGPTCAGKSSIEQELQRLGCGRAISHTTRAPRAGEVNGEHYHFVSDQEYARLKRRGEFIETIEFGTRKYAMAASSISAAQLESDHVAIVVDPHGAEQILNFCDLSAFHTAAVYVDCPVRVQAERWVNRLAGELMSGIAAVGPAAERFELMMTEEQTWREAARVGKIIEGLPRLYTLLLERTDVKPASEWAGLIFSYVNEAYF